MSVKIENPEGEWSRLYTSFRACLLPCYSAEKMLERLGRVKASPILREGMTTEHVVVLSSSDRVPSVLATISSPVFQIRQSKISVVLVLFARATFFEMGTKLFGTGGSAWRWVVIARCWWNVQEGCAVELFQV